MGDLYPADHACYSVSGVEEEYKENDNKSFGAGFNGCASHGLGGLVGWKLPIAWRAFKALAARGQGFLCLKHHLVSKLVSWSGGQWLGGLVLAFEGAVRSRLAIRTAAG